MISANTDHIDVQLIQEFLYALIFINKIIIEPQFISVIFRMFDGGFIQIFRVRKCTNISAL